jgi:hypothetical protein
MKRDWMQIGIAVFVAGMLAYLVIVDGDKEMKMFFCGIFATKIVDFAFKIKIAKSLNPPRAQIGAEPKR